MKQPSSNYGLSGQDHQEAYDPFLGKMVTGVINAFDKKQRNKSNDMNLREQEAQIADTTATANVTNAFAAVMAKGDDTGAGMDTNQLLLIGGAVLAVGVAFFWFQNKQKAAQMQMAPAGAR